MPATKRTITATAPDGAQVSINVGPKRDVGAIRITDFGADAFGAGDRWLVTVHKTLPNAITGPNQTPAWNTYKRHAIAIGADDQPVGRWLPASK
jgi:hypothetical protein